MAYAEHSVKQDPQTHCIAVKTMFSEERAWRVFRLDGVSHLCAEEDVAEWTDLAASSP